MADWKTLSSKVVYETPWIKVHRDEALNQNGKPVTYSFMELQNPSVFIVAMNDSGEILIQSVFRYTIKQRLWEIPAGYIDPDEELLEAAKRELMEEAGLQSENWHSLGCIYQVVGTGKVPLNVFLAEGATRLQDATDKDEDIEQSHFVSQEDLEKMITQGELIDSPVIAALYMVKLHLAKKLKS